MEKLITRASSINRALDQIGDKWCLLIIQEVFWGINSFNDMMAATGVSRGVLSNRLKWLQSVDCLERRPEPGGGRRYRYHLTEKSLDLYQCALMALVWERRYFGTPAPEDLVLRHLACGHAFEPLLRCVACDDPVSVRDVSYHPGPGATRDERDKKVRRRSSIPVSSVPAGRGVYLNLVNLVGDRWTANVIALALHDLKRFEEFNRELPVATNILSNRLKILVAEGVLTQVPYQEAPRRYEYQLTPMGEDMFPWFLTLLQWGDRWCDPAGSGRPMRLLHERCGHDLQGRVRCSECGLDLRAREVEFEFRQPGLAS